MSNEEVPTAEELDVMGFDTVEIWNKNKTMLEYKGGSIKKFLEKKNNKKYEQLKEERNERRRRAEVNIRVCEETGITIVKGFLPYKLSEPIYVFYIGLKVDGKWVYEAVNKAIDANELPVDKPGVYQKFKMAYTSLGKSTKTKKPAPTAQPTSTAPTA